MSTHDESGSVLVGLSYEIQSFYAKITPEYEMKNLLPESEFVFQLIPTVFVVGYLLILKYFPTIQKKHNFIPNMKMRQRIFLFWNIFLSTYSFVAFVYVFTWFIVQWHEKGSFFEIYCPMKKEEIFSGPNVFWYYTFAITKYFELFDTVLLILKNPDRAPIFLHWFHHATMVYCTWWFIRYYYPTYYFGMMINTFVHTNMYFYYALTVFFKPPWAALLTFLQIVQMFSGILLNVAWLYHYIQKGCFCLHPIWMPSYMLFVGSIYMYHFCVFFLKRYLGIGRKKRKTKKKGVVGEEKNK